LRDPEARATRESLDHRWRAALGSVVREGLASGDFTTSDPSTATMRLASLMDGLAIQLALGDPGIDVERFRELWLESAALELGAPALTEPTRHRASSE
jgi:hypothetical protein